MPASPGAVPTESRPVRLPLCAGCEGTRGPVAVVILQDLVAVCWPCATDAALSDEVMADWMRSADSRQLQAPL